MSNGPVPCRRWMVARFLLIGVSAAVMSAAPWGSRMDGLGPARLSAQTPAADRPVFGRVTIRQGAGGPQYLRPLPDGRLEIRGLTLADLIRFAYGPSTYQSPAQIVGGPDWLHQQRFDIDAVGSGDFVRPDPGSTGPPQVVVRMTRAMLEDWFDLKVRTETREQDVYLLRRARPDALGPQISRRADCRPQTPGTAPDPDETCGVVTSSPGVLTGRALPLDQLAVLLGTAPSLGRVVRNETGLDGIYDADLTWVPDVITEPGGNRVPNPDAGSGPDLFAALEQQLGLQLVPGRGPVEVVIVEHATRP